MKKNNNMFFVCEKDDDIDNFKSYVSSFGMMENSDSIESTFTKEEFIDKELTEAFTAVLICKSGDSILTQVNQLMSKCNKGYHHNKLTLIILNMDGNNSENVNLYKILVKKVLVIDFTGHAESTDTEIKEFFDVI